MKKTLINNLDKTFNASLVAAILLIIAAVFFFSRQIFFHTYDPVYYENLYYHSQWNIPASTRGISDGELYKFVGYKLIEGENPFHLNYEVPPFAKSLYGLAQKLTGNGYWVSIILYLGSIAFLYLLANMLLKLRHLVLLCTLLFVTTPFVATQLRETMLDLPLMFLFLVHIYFFVSYLALPKPLKLVLAGVFLGLATGSKIGVYTPFVGLAAILFVILKSRSPKHVISFAAFSFIGYALAFFTYFIRHPNPIPWLRLHEKPISFYLQSGTVADHSSQWGGIFGVGSSFLGDWSPVLPLGVLTTAALALWSIRHKNMQWGYVSVFSIIILGVNSAIPFYARYLMPVIPLFVLSIAFLAKRARYLILALSILNLPYLHGSLIVDKPHGHAEAVARFMSTLAYHELYRSIHHNKVVLAENEFIEVNEYFFQSIGIRKVNVRVDKIAQHGERASARVSIFYDTHYGYLYHETQLAMLKINNQWKTEWSWNILWPGFTPESEIRIVEVKDEEGRNQQFMVYMIPRLMYHWNEHVSHLAALTGEENKVVEQRLRSVVPDDHPRFAGALHPATKNPYSLELIPGASLRKIPLDAEVYLVNGQKQTRLPFVER